MLQKLELGVREATEGVAPGSGLADYANKFYSVVSKPLTTELYMAGNAMLPTLGRAEAKVSRAALTMQD